MPLTNLDVARMRGAQEHDGAINGAEFVRLGIPMLGGCLVCGATIAAYNAHPTRTGYLIGSCCIGFEDPGIGFATIAELDAWELENPEYVEAFDD